MLLTLPLLGALLLGPDPSFPTPVITATVVTGDTVWFVGTRGYDATATAYCHVPATGAWCRQAPPPALATRAEHERPPAGVSQAGMPLPLGAGWSLGCDASAPGETSCGEGRWLADARGSRFSLAHPGAGSEGAEQAYAPPTAAPSAWLASGGTVWIGLGGFASEGMEARGGLVVADSAGATIRHLTHAWLDHATVTSLALDDGGLWIGTMHPGEYGDHGSAGLVRYEPAVGSRAERWSRVTAEGGELPGNLVRAVGAADGMLAVATDVGLAVRDRHGRWSRRFWTLALAGDTIVHALAEVGPELPGGVEALRFLALLELRVPNRGDLLAAATSAGIELAELAGGPPAGDRTPLAQPALAAPLTGAVRQAAAAVHRDVITAVGLLGARDAAPALRALLVGEPVVGQPVASERAMEAAVALVRLGDVTGSDWLRARIAADPGPGEDPSGMFDPRVVAAQGAARVRDAEGMAAIVSLLRRPVLPPGEGASNPGGPAPLSHETGRGLLRALTDFGTPEAWRAAAVAVRVRPLLRGALLESVDDSVTGGDPVLREAVVRETIAGLADPASQRAALGAALSAARDVRLVDAIVLQLRRGLEAQHFRDAVMALVQLTGVADAPHLDYDASEREAVEAALFWSRWAASRAPDFAPVDAAAGRAAVERWVERSFERYRLPDQGAAGDGR